MSVQSARSPVSFFGMRKESNEKNEQSKQNQKLVLVDRKWCSLFVETAARSATIIMGQKVRNDISILTQNVTK